MEVIGRIVFSRVLVRLFSRWADRQAAPPDSAPRKVCPHCKYAAPLDATACISCRRPEPAWIAPTVAAIPPPRARE